MVGDDPTTSPLQVERTTVVLHRHIRGSRSWVLPPQPPIYEIGAPLVELERHPEPPARVELASPSYHLGVLPLNYGGRAYGGSRTHVCGSTVRHPTNERHRPSPDVVSMCERAGAGGRSPTTSRERSSRSVEHRHHSTIRGTRQAVEILDGPCYVPIMACQSSGSGPIGCD